MVFVLPCVEDGVVNQQTVGKLIYNLNLVSQNQTCFQTEPSVVIDNTTFIEYKQTRLLSDSIVSHVAGLLQKLEITQATVYPSFLEECCVNDEPITIRISAVNIRNAVTAIYDRWFDAKPYAKRKTKHLSEEDTYPAILFQPFADYEQTTITRHPRTGAILRGADGINLVHCADKPLDITEEAMITAVDSLINLPGKIVYRREPEDGTIIVRRIEEYRLTTQAVVDCLLSKLEAGVFSPEKFLSLLKPEQIAIVSSQGYCLTQDKQYAGVQRTKYDSAIGHACFPWTDFSKIKEDAIFICDDVTIDDIQVLSKCKGAITTSSRISHASVACGGMGICCISSPSGLNIDYWNKKAYTSDKRRIREGATICILKDRWALGGTIVPSDEYKAVCSRETLMKIQRILAPFTKARKLKTLSLKEQIHISMLIKVMKGCGWLK